MLLDEPDIHLHPLLQLQVLQYLRDLAAEGAAQFILSTHSPTLLDALTDDELYLVSPAAISPDNQLSRLTTSQERLELARSITGSTHLLTRAKPIVFLEGEEERGGVSSDARVVGSLIPDTKSWALVPGRAKQDVIKSVQQLRQNGLDLPGMPVLGLVDSDTDSAPDDEHVVAWPVTMIENFLLDAQAIHSVLQPFGSQTRAVSISAVQEALNQAAKNREEDEVRLRVQRQLPIDRLTLYPHEIQNAGEIAKAASDKRLEKLRALDIPALTAAAQAEVDDIIATGQQLNRFHGKKMLHAVYASLGVAAAGLSKPAFALSLSANDYARERASRLAGPSIQRIRLFFPAGLPDVLRGSGDLAIGEPLAVRCQAQFRAR